MHSNHNIALVKGHEILTFSVFKCYNWIPGPSTNPENVKKNNPVNFFW